MMKIPSECEFASNWPKVGMQDAAVKVAGVSDAGYATRVEWISTWIDAHDQRFCVSPGSRLLGVGSPSFDVLVLHGDDLGDLTRLVGDARATYVTVVLIVVQSQATPAARATLLNAGADTVWDLEQSPQEAAASLHAVLRRHRATYLRPVDEAVSHQKIA